MKHALLRHSTAALTALLASTTLVQAHPGHSAFDWVSSLPHPGHEGEYGAVLLATLLTGVVLGACWLASRRS